MSALSAIAIGAVLGAWSRYALALIFNGKGNWPMGTLIANAVGGFLMGLCLAFFATRTDLNPAWKLAIVTGFLGALTTFSTYSAEVLELFQRGQLASALGLALTHVVISFALCAAGHFSFRFFN